jgi:phenylacetate-CoA ligase
MVKQLHHAKNTLKKDGANNGGRSIMHKPFHRFVSFLIRDKTIKYFDLFKKNLSLSKQEMIKLQNILIQKLIKHAYDQTQYYRELMDSLNIKPEDIKCKEDLKKLPILTKSTVRQNIKKIKSNDKYSKNLEEYTSSGSTGNQAVIYKSIFYK